MQNLQAWQDSKNPTHPPSKFHRSILSGILDHLELYVTLPSDVISNRKSCRVLWSDMSVSKKASGSHIWSAKWPLGLMEGTCRYFLNASRWSRQYWRKKNVTVKSCRLDIWKLGKETDQCIASAWVMCDTTCDVMTWHIMWGEMWCNVTF